MYFVFQVVIFFRSDGDQAGIGVGSAVHKTNTASKKQLLKLVNKPGTINTLPPPAPVNNKNIEITDNHSYMYPESKFAHTLLDGLLGIEISAGAHNGFGLDTINVDSTSEVAEFQEAQIKMVGVYRRVDVVAHANKLPFDDASLDFVVSQNVVQHIHDPVGLFCEWARVVKDGGFIFTVLPNKSHSFVHRDKPSTPLTVVIERHKHKKDEEDQHGGDWITWSDHDALEFAWYMGVQVIDSQLKDDKVGDGFAFVIKVQRNSGLVSPRCSKLQHTPKTLGTP